MNIDLPETEQNDNYQIDYSQLMNEYIDMNIQLGLNNIQTEKSKKISLDKKKINNNILEPILPNPIDNNCPSDSNAFKLQNLANELIKISNKLVNKSAKNKLSLEDKSIICGGIRQISEELNNMSKTKDNMHTDNLETCSDITNPCPKRIKTVSLTNINQFNFLEKFG